MFERLSIETTSYCNRRCATCLRQIYPDRERLAPWFARNYMPTETVYSILDQAHEMGFHDIACFNLYNEPMLDKRLPAFGAYAMSLGFGRVMFASNGDFLDEPMVRSLDGCFHSIQLSPYEEAHKAYLLEMQALFTKTRIRFTSGLHFRIHCFDGDDAELHDLNERRCFNVGRNLAINHRGESLACCQEVVPHFALGNVHDTPLAELWQAKQRMISHLRRHGGRHRYPYCMTCLRGSHKEYVPVVPL